ncbi:TPA: DUF3021 family protein [Streptococcus suis]
MSVKKLIDLFWLIFILVYALLFFLNYRKMERQIKEINGRL